MNILNILLEELVNSKKFKELTTTNPEHVLNNEEFEVDSPEELKFNFIEKKKLKIK